MKQCDVRSEADSEELRDAWEVIVNSCNGRQLTRYTQVRLSALGFRAKGKLWAECDME